MLMDSSPKPWNHSIVSISSLAHIFIPNSCIPSTYDGASLFPFPNTQTRIQSASLKCVSKKENSVPNRFLNVLFLFFVPFPPLFPDILSTLSTSTHLSRPPSPQTEEIHFLLEYYYKNSANASSTLAALGTALLVAFQTKTPPRLQNGSRGRPSPLPLLLI